MYTLLFTHMFKIKYKNNTIIKTIISISYNTNKKLKNTFLFYNLTLLISYVYYKLGMRVSILLPVVLTF